MAHVKSLRPHVSLGEAQQRAVQAFAEHCKASGGGGGVAAATPSEGQDGGAAAAAAEQQPAEEEPSCSCLKQKPKMKTWPSRHIRIQGKSLMVYDDEESSERYNPTLLTHYFSATFRPSCAIFSPLFCGFRLPGAKTERTGEEWRKMGEIWGRNGR